MLGKDGHGHFKSGRSFEECAEDLFLCNGDFDAMLGTGSLAELMSIVCVWLNMDGINPTGRKVA